MAAAKSIKAGNPLVGTNPVDTIDKCRSVLTYVANATQEMGGPNLDYGRFLILESVCRALEHVEEEISRPGLEVVRA